LLVGTQSSLETCTDSIIWFLPALFTARIVYQCVIWLTNRVIKQNLACWKGILSILLLLTGAALGKWGANSIPLGADVGLVGCSLMLMGSLMKKAVMQLRQRGWLIKISVALLSLAGSILFSYMNMPFERLPNGSVVYETAIWMARGMYGKNELLFMLSSLSGCLLILTLSMMLERFRFLSTVGQHTLGLMVVHNKVYPYVVSLLSGISYLNGQTGLGLQILITLTALLFSVPWCLLISHFAPWLEGHTPHQINKED